MIPSLVVDDEPKNISMLCKLLEDFCPGVQVVGSARNMADARELILKLQPKLVLLDVEMPEGSGLDLLDSFTELPFKVIFVTAYRTYALDAFRYASVDYLLKPVDIEQLQKAVARALKRIQEKAHAQDYLQLKQNLEAKALLEQKIILQRNIEQYPVKLKDISYCIAEGSYTHIHLRDGSTFLSSRNLKDFEALLPAAYFHRIHHGHLINLGHIIRIQKTKTCQVVMQDGRILEISGRRKTVALEKIRQHMQI